MNLTPEQKRWIAWGIVTVVTLAVSIFFGVNYPIPEPPLFVSPVQDDIIALGVTHLSGLAIGSGTADLAAGDDDLYVVGDLEVDDEIEADGVVDMDAGATIDGGVTNIGGGTPTLAAGDNDLFVTADLEADGIFLPSFADETITDGETLTPTKTIYALDSASAVTVTLAASAQEGQLLILIGDDANDITIADSNIRTNDGNAQVLNVYDVLILVYQDSEWVEISESNNS